jgi:diguanylate cyclase (GGDEF)-like protein
MGANRTRRSIAALGLAAALLLAVPTTIAIALGNPVAGLLAAASSLACAAIGWRVVHITRTLTTSRHDPVTGLPTQEALSSALARALHEEPQNGALLYFDLDRFEMVNEALGRDAGDRLLLDVAKRLQRSSSPDDVLARIGGDEFAIFLPHTNDLEDARGTAEMLRRAIGRLRAQEGDHIADVRASIGVTTLAGTGTVSDVLRRADTACRAAKVRGRNRVEVYRPALSEQAQHIADASWSVRVKDALKGGRLTVVFQPIASVGDGGVEHYETLVRMIGADGNLVAAEEFIATAERCGLIRAIDRFVIRATLERMSIEETCSCAINLSALSLHDDTLEYIRYEIERSGVAPQRITFELTESAAIENLAKAHAAIETLRGIGCRFALDDFGKGLASFAHLRYLPVDFLKIDGAFVRNLATDQVNRAMVRSMNELAHSLGIQTIAECVEDEASLEALAEIGVDLAQGWHVGYPSETLGTRAVVPELRPLRLEDFWPATEIVLPPREPQEIVEFIAFLDRLDVSARDLRDAEAIPQSVTRPDDLDAVVVEIVGAMRKQAEAAIANGDSRVTIRLPVSKGLNDLMEWTSPRMDMLDNLTRGGLVQPEWMAPLEIMNDFFVTACRQLGRGELSSRAQPREPQELQPLAVVKPQAHPRTA